MASVQPGAVCHDEQKGLFSAPRKEPQLLSSSLDGSPAEHARLLPSWEVRLARQHHALQGLNPGRGTLSATQDLQDVSVCSVSSIRTARGKAKFPRLWVERGTV